MSNNSTTQQQGGIGFTGLLFIVFLVLKLTGYISWSWWYVTAPLWGPLAFVAVIVLGIVLGHLLFGKR